jgi:AAA ATPase domain
MLVGRETEIATLERLLGDARSGRSAALPLRGGAVIGKTALLEHAARAAEGFHVLRATGIHAEGELPYATLHQLLRPLRHGGSSSSAPRPSSTTCARCSRSSTSPRGPSWRSSSRAAPP